MEFQVGSVPGEGLPEDAIRVAGHPLGVVPVLLPAYRLERGSKRRRLRLKGVQGQPPIVRVQAGGSWHIRKTRRTIVLGAGGVFRIRGVADKGGCGPGVSKRKARPLTPSISDTVFHTGRCHRG